MKLPDNLEGLIKAQNELDSTAFAAAGNQVEPTVQLGQCLSFVHTTKITRVPGLVNRDKFIPI